MQLRVLGPVILFITLWSSVEAQFRGQGIRDVYMDFNLLDAVKIPPDDGVSFVHGYDNFPAYSFKASADVKSPYRLVLPEKLYEFAIIAIFKPETRSGGYLFSVVNPLDTIVQLGIHISPAITDKWNITLLYTDPSLHLTSKKLATFEVVYAKKWTKVVVQVLSNKVVFYHNCILIDESAVTREPAELVFDSASTLYLAQAGSIIKGHFELEDFLPEACNQCSALKYGQSPVDFANFHLRFTENFQLQCRKIR